MKWKIYFAKMFLKWNGIKMDKEKRVLKRGVYLKSIRFLHTVRNFLPLVERSFSSTILRSGSKENFTMSREWSVVDLTFIFFFSPSFVVSPLTLFHASGNDISTLMQRHRVSCFYEPLSALLPSTLTTVLSFLNSLSLFHSLSPTLFLSFFLFFYHSLSPSLPSHPWDGSL